MPSANRPWWQQATALVSLGAGGAITGFSFIPKPAAELTSPSSMPIGLMALEQSAQRGQADGAPLRAAIINVARYYLRMAESKTPAEMEAIIWQRDSLDGVNHGESCAAFASLTLELGAHVVGQQSWVTGGSSYPWPLHKWADARVNPNPGSPGVTSIVQDAEAHQRWHPAGDGYQPQPGDWVVFDGHVEVVTSYADGVLDTIGGDSLPNFSVNAHQYPAPLSDQGVLGFVDNGDLPSTAADTAGGGTAPAADTGGLAEGMTAIPGTLAAAAPSGQRGQAAADAAIPGTGAAPGTERPSQAGPAGGPGQAADPGHAGGSGQAADPGHAGGSGQAGGSGKGKGSGQAGAPGQGRDSAQAGRAGLSKQPAPEQAQPAHRGTSHRGRAGSTAGGTAGAGAGVPGAYLSGAGAWTRAATAETAPIPGLPMMAHRLSAQAAAQPTSPYRRHRPSQGAVPGGGTSAQQAFIGEVAPLAVAAQRKYGVPASVTIAQAIDESGWGQSGLAVNDHNLFGIKGTGPAGSFVQQTQEYEDGQLVTTSSSFRVYRTAAESVDDHGRLLATSGYYRRAMAVRGNPDAFASSLTGVYATDPDYGTKLIKLMKQYDLYRYDRIAPAASPKGAAATPAGAASHSPAAPPTAAPAGAAPIPAGPAPGTAAQLASIPGAGAPSVRSATAAPGAAAPARRAARMPGSPRARPGGPAVRARSRPAGTSAAPAGPAQAAGKTWPHATRPRTAASAGAPQAPPGTSRPAPGSPPATGPGQATARSGRPAPDGRATGGRASAGTRRPVPASPRASRAAPSTATARRPVPRAAGGGRPAPGSPAGAGAPGTASIPGVTDPAAPRSAGPRPASSPRTAPGPGARTDAAAGQRETAPATQAVSARLLAAVSTGPRRSAPGPARARAAKYRPQIPPAVRSAYAARAKEPLLLAESLYRDVADHRGIGWQLLAACDWMQCRAGERHSPVHGEKLGRANADGSRYRTKSEALDQCADELTALAWAVYGIDLAGRRYLSVRDLASVFAAFRWGGLLLRHRTSAMEFPYSVAGLTARHVKMRWPSIDEPNAPDRPGGRFRMPFGAVPVVLFLNYPARA